MKKSNKVSFHDASIPRPQDEYKIVVDNYRPFQHVWLERSEDGSRFVHPLEKLSVEEFAVKSSRTIEPLVPPPVEDFPFTLVEDVRKLKELAAKLKDVDEFAVDLEHNKYRSFQGLTCLMQISTRTEDFVIDTLKLRIYVGPYLREIFRDPLKRKVMHGAECDILWLQRDFGIYVCNLFDTGQASWVMQLEKHSLEYLLLQFCGVTANKEYQNSDWRVRPIPEVMLKYAREDTHYLLHLYDLMMIRLLSESSDGNGKPLLIEVYKRSYKICIQLYEKELLTNSSYSRIYGLREANFNSQQLAIVAGLYTWRDTVARAVDESTGYILPNKLLLEIARQRPSSFDKLLPLVKSKCPFVECDLNTFISIIKNSIRNAAAFESVTELWEKEQLEAAYDQLIGAVDCSFGFLLVGPMMSLSSPKDVSTADNGTKNTAASTSAEGQGQCQDRNRWMFSSFHTSFLWWREEISEPHLWESLMHLLKEHCHHAKGHQRPIG